MGLRAPDYPAMEDAMSAMCDAITPVHGTPYDYGSICSWFGLASGGSIDTTVSATSRAAFAPSTR